MYFGYLYAMSMHVVLSGVLNKPQNPAECILDFYRFFGMFKYQPVALFKELKELM